MKPSGRFTPGLPHRLGRRVATGLCLVLLLGGSSADAHDLNSCSHHGIPISATSGPTVAADHGGSHGNHVGSPTGHHGDSSGHDPHGHGPCVCIGDCSAPAALALSRSGGTVARDARLIDDPSPPHLPLFPPQQLLPYVLPYALAPPPGA